MVLGIHFVYGFSTRVGFLHGMLFVARFLLSLEQTQGKQPIVQGLREDRANVYKD